MKKSIIAIALAAMALAGCNNTDIDLFNSPAQEAGSGTLKQDYATVSILEFDWEPVEGVYQYGYRLAPKATGLTMSTGVTGETHLRFENLEPDTEYELTVEAYGSNGHPTKIFAIDGRTNAIAQLQAPDVASFELTVSTGFVTIEWPAVPNAAYYDYKLTTVGGSKVASGVVETNSVEFAGLGIGNYKLEVTAESGIEDYSVSETVVYIFSREKLVVGTYTGKYVSYGLGATEQRTVNKYDDGTYSIQAFYGVAGYNLEFSLDKEDETFHILNHYDENGAYRYVETGLEDNSVLTVYCTAEYCTFVKLPTGNRIKFYSYLGDSENGGYDSFTWKE